jgi:hypothetical protein
MQDDVEEALQESEQVRSLRTLVSGPYSKDLAVFGVIFAVGWLANFSLASEFGLYEDDYLVTASLFNMSWRALWHYYLPWCFATAPQARPVGYALNGLLAYFTGKQGLELGYMLGWIIHSINGLLTYGILRKRLGSVAGIVGACTFILFPADLAKQILMHRAFVNLSVTCTLSGIILYQRGTLISKLGSYLVAGFSLLIWEGPFLAFLVAPLLVAKKPVKFWREFLGHILIFAGILGCTLLVRITLGEDRAARLITGVSDSIPKMAMALIVGPVTVLSTFVSRPLETVLHADMASRAVTVLAFTLLLLILRSVCGAADLPPSNQITVVLAAGLVAAIFPYVLMYRTYYFPPTTTIGRLSAVHAPSEFGFSVVAASLYALAQLRSRDSRWLLFFAAAFFAVLAGFGMHIQRVEYVASWTQQRELWKDILQNSGDATEGMPIVIDMTNIPQTQGFPAVWWEFGVADSFPVFAKVPKAWKRPPIVVGYADHTQEKDGVPLQARPWNETVWSTLRNREFIFLKFVRGHLMRQNDPVKIFGMLLFPKSEGTPEPWPLSGSGRRLLNEPDSHQWLLLRESKPYPWSNDAH